MNARSLLAAPQASADGGEPVRGVFDSRSAMCLLFRKAAPTLTHDELLWLAIDGSDHAQHLSRHAGQLAESLGGLIHADEEGRAGYFRSTNDVPALLFHLAGTFQQIASLVNVSGEAASTLMDRGAT